MTTPFVPKHIVLTTFGTHGDIVPFIGIAKQLQALGHRPVLATSSFFAPLAAQHGVEFHPVAPHHSQHDKDLGLLQTERLQKAFHPLTGGKFVMEKLVYPYMDQICDELAQACEGADLLVAPPTTPWAHLVAHRVGMPWKSLIVQALTLSVQSAQDPPVVSNHLSLRPLPKWIGERNYARAFKWLRDSSRAMIKPLDDKAREYGIFNKQSNPMFEGCISPRGSIALFPELMMRKPLPTDLPGQVSFAGFNYFDGNTAPLSDELEAFLQAGEPPVVFSLGSSLWFQAKRFYPVWSRMCERLGVRAIFLAGEGALPTPLPAGQVVAGWASVGALFPRCKAVVNPGGCGISSQVMNAGIPQLIVPFGMDQPDNAARLTQLGAALSVKPGQAKDKTFELALHRLVKDTALHARAKSLRQEINAECGTVEVARLLDLELQNTSHVAKNPCVHPVNPARAPI